MKIGIVVDGDAEYGSLSALYTQLKDETGHTYYAPIRAPLQPLAPPRAIGRTASKAAAQLVLRGAERVLVLIDREGRHECPPDLAGQIADAIDGVPDGLVVIKDRMFENWLVADIDALKAQPGKYELSAATESRVTPDKADNVDGIALIKRSLVRGQSYHKVRDSRKILEKATLAGLAQNSRSFRRFLACAGHPSYTSGSRHSA